MNNFILSCSGCYILFLLNRDVIRKHFFFACFFFAERLLTISFGLGFSTARGIFSDLKANLKQTYWNPKASLN